MSSHSIADHAVTFVYTGVLHAVPGSMADVRIVSLTSKSVDLLWSSIDCHQQNGPSVGYSCELIQLQSASHDVETPHDIQTSRVVQTSNTDGNVVRRQVVNGTQLYLDQLVPFTHYTFAVSFRNSDFDGPKTFVNFTTDEDGL